MSTRGAQQKQCHKIQATVSLKVGGVTNWLNAGEPLENVAIGGMAFSPDAYLLQGHNHTAQAGGGGAYPTKQRSCRTRFGHAHTLPTPRPPHKHYIHSPQTHIYPPPPSPLIRSFFFSLSISGFVISGTY
jgi:hypothetical protein